MQFANMLALVDNKKWHTYIQGSAKRSADFVKQQPGRARQKS